MDKAYEQYLQKCKELGIKPSPKKKIFGEDITKEKNQQHVDIASLSQARKQKAPVLSEMAKEALVVAKKPKAKSVKKAVVEKTAVAKPKVEKPKLIKEKVVKQKRVLLTPEQKLENTRECARRYYAENKEEIKAHQRATRAENNSNKVILSDEEKKAKAKENARLYHLQKKNCPEYQKRRNANCQKWNNDNRDKIAASNKKYRDEVRTPEQLEEKKKKAREYYQNNLEKMRAKDRARNKKRRASDLTPEQLERKRELDRARYHKTMEDPQKKEKMLAKWRHDSEIKKENTLKSLKSQKRV